MAGGAPSVRHGYHLADLTILTGLQPAEDRSGNRGITEPFKAEL
jgi:hypothetical protein